MDFDIVKNIKYRPKNSFHWVIGIPILILLIPIIALVLIVMFISFGYHKIFNKTKLDNVNKESRNFILDNEKIKIELKAMNDSFNELEDYWCENVYDEDAYLYMAYTTPVIDSIDGQIFGDFKFEMQNGVILHKVIYDKTDIGLIISSKLLYLDFKTLDVSTIEDFGAFFLYAKKYSDNIIFGFNKSSDIELKIQNVC